MEALSQEKAKGIPGIKGDPNSCHLLIEGICLVEDPRSFFIPVIEWTKKVCELADKQVRVDLDIEYMNTTSALYIMMLLQKLKQYEEKKDVRVSWIYEKDDIEMKGVGEEYKLILGDMIELKEKKEVD